MGRFINQGGLLKGLKTMCRESAKKGVIREEVSKHVNVEIKCVNSTLEIVASKNLSSY